MRGQIAYATPALRAAHGMPSAVSEVDDIELSQMEPFVSLAAIAVHGTQPRGANRLADAHPGSCTCAPRAPQLGTLT